MLLPQTVFGHVQPASEYFVPPDGDTTPAGWTVQPLWSKIDEDIPNDGLHIVSITNPVHPGDAATFSLASVVGIIPLDETITSICSGISAFKVGGRFAEAIVQIYSHLGGLVAFERITLFTFGIHVENTNCLSIPPTTLSDFDSYYMVVGGSTSGGGSGTTVHVQSASVYVNTVGPFPDLPVDITNDMVKLVYILLLIGFLTLGFVFRAGIFFIAAIFLVILLMIDLDVMFFYLIGSGLIASFIFLGANVSKE